MRSLRYLLAALPLGAVLFFAANCFNPEYQSGNGVGYFCNDTAGQTCPDGQSCVGGRCLAATGTPGGTNNPIVKTGLYSGPVIDPMLNSADACPDKVIEPNDSLGTAVQLSDKDVAIDGAVAQLQHLAICPTGDNPLANGHDVDYYGFTVAGSGTALVNITYDIKYGDLDVGVFRADGSAVATDGSAVSNGCVAAAVTSGAYYVGVFGAKNTAVNTYTMSIRLSSMARQCTGGTDGGI